MSGGIDKLGRDPNVNYGRWQSGFYKTLYDQPIDNDRVGKTQAIRRVNDGGRSVNVGATIDSANGRHQVTAYYKYEAGSHVLEFAGTRSRENWLVYSENGDLHVRKNGLELTQSELAPYVITTPEGLTALTIQMDHGQIGIPLETTDQRSYSWSPEVVLVKDLETGDEFGINADGVTQTGKG